ncbi:MAG: hypothetical protein M3380_01805, partial [Chloroflexota bacterium]|nr:hypothetical protein [Chloroflexota bacterium]
MVGRVVGQAQVGAGIEGEGRRQDAPPAVLAGRRAGDGPVLLEHRGVVERASLPLRTVRFAVDVAENVAKRVAAEGDHRDGAGPPRSPASG